MGTEKVISYLEKVAEAQDEVMWKYMSYQKMGQLFHVLGDYEQAVKYYEIAAQGFAKGDKGFKVAEVNGSLIEMCLESGDYEEAIRLLKEKEYSQRMRYSSTGETENPADITSLIFNLEKYYFGSQSVLQKEDFRHYLMEIMRIDGRGRLEQAQALEAKIKALGEDDVLVRVLIEIARDRV